MQLPFIGSHVGSPEKPKNLNSLEMAQAIGGVVFPDKLTDPVVLDLRPGERPEHSEKWPIKEDDRIAESRVDQALYELDLKAWRAKETDTEHKLTGIVDTFLGLNSEDPKKVDDYDWARIYDPELSMIKRDYPNPKPIKPGTEVK